VLTSCCSSAVAEAQAVTDATSALAIDKEFVLAGLLAVYEAGVRLQEASKISSVSTGNSAAIK